MDAQSKKIGLFSAVVIQTNAMIGAGVVAIPAILAQTTGSLGLLSYVICILIIFCMTFSLGELSLLHGGQAWCYRFPHIWGKHIVGMISSSCYVLGVLIAMGFVAKQAGIWLHEIFPFLSSDVLCLLIIGVLSAFVCAGKNISSFWQYFYSIIICLGIIITISICFMNFKEELFFAKHRGSISSILMITPLILFSFLGFESISSLYTIVKNPRKNVFLGGIIGVLSVGVLYIAFSSSVIGAIAPSYFSASGEHSLAKVLTTVFPHFQSLSKFIYFGGLFAIIGTLHSMIWSVSVLLMDVIKKSKSKKIKLLINRKIININFSTLFSCLLIMVSSFALTSKSIMNAAVFLIATSYILSIMALFNEKKHHLLNRVICITGIFGGCLMGMFSLYSLVETISSSGRPATALHYHYNKISGTPTFVFLHGFMGSKKDWEPIVTLLGGRFSSLVIDLPGHGDSRLESDKVYTMDGCSRLIVDILDKLEIPKAILVGYSMGGRLSLHLALHYPQYFTELVMESASPGIKELSDRHTRRRNDHILADKLEKEDFDEFLNRWYANPLFASLASSPERLDRVKNSRKNNDVRFLAKSLRFMGTGMQQSFWEKLEELTMPLCLIVGEKDKKFTRLAYEMAECYEKARVIIIRNVGHNVHEENPIDYFNALMTTSDKGLESNGRKLPSKEK